MTHSFYSFSVCVNIEEHPSAAARVFMTAAADASNSDCFVCCVCVSHTNHRVFGAVQKQHIIDVSALYSDAVNLSRVKNFQILFMLFHCLVISKVSNNSFYVFAQNIYCDILIVFHFIRTIFFWCLRTVYFSLLCAAFYAVIMWFRQSCVLLFARGYLNLNLNLSFNHQGTLCAVLFL